MQTTFQRTLFSLLLVAVCFSPLLEAEESLETTERVTSLELTHEVSRDGYVDVEQRFRFLVEGKKVKRGFRISYLTVFRGPGQLVLENQMEVLEVLHEGAPFPYEIERSHGQLFLTIGEEENLLEHREHEFVIRYRCLGDWMIQSGEAFGTIDITEQFRQFVIDRASLRLILPEGTTMGQYSVSLSDGADYEAEKSGNEFVVKTQETLPANGAFFLNTSWSLEGFSSASRWKLVLLQHPRIPIALFTAVVLLWILVTLVVRIFRNSAIREVAARAS